MITARHTDVIDFLSHQHMNFHVTIFKMPPARLIENTMMTNKNRTAQAGRHILQTAPARNTVPVARIISRAARSDNYARDVFTQPFSGMSQNLRRYWSQLELITVGRSSSF